MSPIRHPAGYARIRRRGFVDVHLQHTAQPSSGLCHRGGCTLSPEWSPLVHVQGAVTGASVDRIRPPVMVVWHFAIRFSSRVSSPVTA
ncbi:hypothetical protein [Escherichia coli]|uniref:hypothetical protein n=1 Tax=Escherichia coli TaxID=562 RepID=UPI002226EC4A|nr:hypothetical protein [Escherichia coli]MCW3365101.1 hypothetical protein [Escherichia coli]